MEGDDDDRPFDAEEQKMADDALLVRAFGGAFWRGCVLERMRFGDAFWRGCVFGDASLVRIYCSFAFEARSSLFSF